MGNGESRTTAVKPKEMLDAILSGAELRGDDAPESDAARLRGATESAEDAASASLRARLGVLEEDGRLPSLAVMRHALNVQAGDFALIAQALADFATPEGEVPKDVFIDEVVHMLPDVHHEAVHSELLALIFDALAGAGSVGAAPPAGGGGEDDDAEGEREDDEGGDRRDRRAEEWEREPGRSGGEPRRFDRASSTRRHQQCR